MGDQYNAMRHHRRPTPHPVPRSPEPARLRPAELTVHLVWRALRAVLAVGLFLGLLAWALPHFINVDPQLRSLVERANRGLAGRISIDTARVSMIPFLGVRLRGVELRAGPSFDAAAVLRSPEMRLVVDLGALVAGRLRVRAHAQNADVNLDRDAQGRWSLPDVWPGAPPPKPARRRTATAVAPKGPSAVEREIERRSEAIVRRPKPVAPARTPAPTEAPEAIPARREQPSVFEQASLESLTIDRVLLTARIQGPDGGRDDEGTAWARVELRHDSDEWNARLWLLSSTGTRLARAYLGQVTQSVGIHRLDADLCGTPATSACEADPPAR